MPRINNVDYGNRRAALQADWQKGSALLAQLSAEHRDALRALYHFLAQTSPRSEPRRSIGIRALFTGLGSRTDPSQS